MSRVLLNGSLMVTYHGRKYIIHLNKSKIMKVTEGPLGK